jgi:signal peptidase I
MMVTVPSPPNTSRTERQIVRASRRTRVARQCGFHQALRALVGCGLALIMADTWFVAGLALPTVVVSGSMAQATLGPHRRWQCAGCDQPFVCSQESLPAGDQPAVCPWCGVENATASGRDRPGERLLIDRSVFEWRSPRRWEAVVCRSPEATGDWCLKRVVGLPGENVALDDGQVWIDGRVAAKPLEAARALAVPVSRACDVERHWRADAQGRWRTERCAARHRTAAAASELAWLTYARPAPHSNGEGGSELIYDESPSDQNESRVLQPISDLIVSCDARLGEASVLAIRLRSRCDVFELEITPAKNSGRLSRNDKRVADFALPPGTTRGPCRVELAVIDRGAQAAIGGKLLVNYPFEPAEGAGWERLAPAALGARGEVDVSRLELLRDLHYTQPKGPVQYRLGPDEYFVLSDNSPHGTDSRDWAVDGGMTQDLLVGKALGR